MKNEWLWLAVVAGMAAMVLLVAGCTTNQPATPGASVTATQTICPVMGNSINRDIFVDYQGRRIYFCCQMCPDKFKADPAKYLAVLDGGQGTTTTGTTGSQGSGTTGGSMGCCQ